VASGRIFAEIRFIDEDVVEEYPMIELLLSLFGLCDFPYGGTG
jgi:hypothetical protein